MNDICIVFSSKALYIPPNCCGLLRNHARVLSRTSCLRYRFCHMQASRPRRLAQHSCVFHCVFCRFASGGSWIRAGMCWSRIYLRCMVRAQSLHSFFQYLFLVFQCQACWGNERYASRLTTRLATQTRCLLSNNLILVESLSHLKFVSCFFILFFFPLQHSLYLLAHAMFYLSLTHSFTHTLFTCVMFHTSLIHIFIS